MVLEIIIAWFLDLLLGDPAWLPHPIVGFGKWIAWGERHLNRGRHRMLKGALFALTSITLVFLLVYALLELFSTINCQLSIINCQLSTLNFISVVLIFFCLAGHTLRKEVRDVFKAVDRSIEAGRAQVSRIVGRDTSQLTAQEIRTAALETLAENLSDGVVAPLFWLVLLGVPGMMTYKMINTLDSMIGYKTSRYREFGCWAAHIDDIANYIPARITALLMVMAPLLLPRGGETNHKASPRGGLERAAFVLKYGPQHASPNSGWPEAALASILDCQFGGPHNYFGEQVYKPFIGTNPRALTTDDIRRSIRICFVVEVLCVILTLTLTYFAN
ncbi:MAG: cobalamin biosynthesis protein CobD [Bacteroidaceae bacterium]|nr:cobalamin biosynthesis protein CobD [Bacteroidaceae bacterium]